VAERILEAFHKGGPFHRTEDFLEKGSLVNPDLPLLTCSIGIVANGEEETVDGFIKKADESLYLAKNQGKNRACIFPGQEDLLKPGK